jgi:hypothetical protein
MNFWFKISETNQFKEKIKICSKILNETDNSLLTYEKLINHEETDINNYYSNAYKPILMPKARS